MKTLQKQQKHIITMLLLIFICEIMLNINNKIIQMMGVCIVPIIIIQVILIIKSDKERV